MKKQLAAILLAVAMGTPLWGTSQESKTVPFDTKKAQQELQIMKGILNTTLDFVVQEMSGSSERSRPRVFRSWRSSGIDAFYLYGQGAVFMIPSSALSAVVEGEAAVGVLRRTTGGVQGIYLDAERARADVERARAEMEALRRQMEELQSEQKNPPAVTPVPAPPAAPAVPRPPKPPKQEELRKRVQEAQEAVKKRQEQIEATRKKMMEALGTIKENLIEAVANYGASMTVVKPEEFINLILVTDERGYFSIDDTALGATQQVISIRKSLIDDYKAGRLTLEAFKQKVVEYNQ